MADKNSPKSPQVNLEEQLMFQQRQLEELNAVVLAQQGQIDTLQQEHSILKQSMQETLDRLGDELPHEKPPHY